jgi:glycosyltransferase involved in cell wall biosynthesis
VKFSVIIATKDRETLLDAALASLRAQQDAPPFELVVVDNGSRDDTRGVAERHGAVYVYVAEPNRGAARNAGVAAASGDAILFCDDDVVTPPGFLRAHAAAHDEHTFPRAVSGPIINVPDAGDRPTPTAVNASRAFFVTCNVSIRKASFAAVGGFDESFDLYGWEDTELGARLRAHGVRRHFAWDAYLWHIKPPTVESLDVLLGKSLEKAHMAARFLRKNQSLRVRLATGGYALNLARARMLAPQAAQPLLAGIASSPVLPAPLRAFAREALLDNVYTNELMRALKQDA